MGNWWGKKKHTRNKINYHCLCFPSEENFHAPKPLDNSSGWENAWELQGREGSSVGSCTSFFTKTLHSPVITHFTKSAYSSPQSYHGLPHMAPVWPPPFISALHLLYQSCWSIPLRPLTSQALQPEGLVFLFVCFCYSIFF